MNNYYCVLPFYSVETTFDDPNKNIYCCRLPANTDIELVQNSIKNKTRSPNCNTCWRLEDQGLKSERQIHNETLDYLFDVSIENLEIQSVAQGFKPQSIKIATSNLCNGQCITCNSHYSSSWARLEDKPVNYKRLDYLGMDIDWASIVSLSFVGGEPFLEKRNFEILENLVELGNHNCFISIVTNGSVSLTDKQIAILSNFKKLNICISIDGTGSVFEYLRFPLKWDDLLKNLKQFRTITDNISVSCMISNLNVLYYTELVDFFKDQQINYMCKQVTQPYIFAPGNLPGNLKKHVLDRNKKYATEVNGFLNCGQYSEFAWQSFLNELNRQDQIKKINRLSYVQEFANLL